MPGLSQAEKDEINERYRRRYPNATPERVVALPNADIGACRELIRDAIGTCRYAPNTQEQTLSLLKQIQERFERLHPRV